MADPMIKAALRAEGDDGYSVATARSKLGMAQFRTNYWTAQLSHALARDGNRPWVTPTLTTQPLDRRV
jgi:hypothetical protein